jgi:hypothetical protein
MITIRFNYHCTLALPVDMKTTEAATLFELLSRCTRIESIYASDAKESIEFAESLELAIKRVAVAYPSRSEAEGIVRDRNAAALAGIAMAEAAHA